MARSIKLGVAAAFLGTVGCVPLSDYRALEERYKEQEQYVLRHRGRVGALEQNESALQERTQEQTRQLELARERLQRSEQLRQRLQDELDQARAEAAALAAQPAPQPTLPAAAPREEAPVVEGFEVNPATQGIMLDHAVLFAPGRAELKNDGRRVLDRLRDELNSSDYRRFRVRIEGHTDDVPISRSATRHQSNWDLSGKRALAVLHYLEENGIDAGRLCFSGYGPHQPFVQGTDADARARNRRVEVVLFED